MRVIGLFLSQCFFLRLPFNWRVTEENYKWAAIFYFSVFWTIQLLLMGDPAEAFIAAASELALTQVFVLAVLALSGSRDLFVPTATLLMGALAMVGLFAVPLLVWLRLAENGHLIAAFYSVIGFALWGLVVLGHVFRQTLSKPPSFGFGVACVYAVETYLGTLMLMVL